jgi:hypothetical protein
MKMQLKNDPFAKEDFNLMTARDYQLELVAHPVIYFFAAVTQLPLVHTAAAVIFICERNRQEVTACRQFFSSFLHGALFANSQAGGKE